MTLSIADSADALSRLERLNPIPRVYSLAGEPCRILPAINSPSVPWPLVLPDTITSAIQQLAIQSFHGPYAPTEVTEWIKNRPSHLILITPTLIRAGLLLPSRPQVGREAVSLRSLQRAVLLYPEEVRGSTSHHLSALRIDMARDNLYYSPKFFSEYQNIVSW